jgi:hypothetical protein
MKGTCLSKHNAEKKKLVYAKKDYSGWKFCCCCSKSTVYNEQNRNKKKQLIYVRSNFKIICESITQLKKNGLPLTDSIKIIENVFTSLKKSPAPVAAVALKKLEDVTEKNLGYKFLPELARIFRGEDVPEHETKMEEINYKFAPITSCKVERSFSKYKSILVDNRQCFRIENLEQYIVCNVNTSIQGGNFNWNKIHNLEIGNFCKKIPKQVDFYFSLSTF